MAIRLERPRVSAKTLLRRGTARAALGRIDDARTDFKQVVALEPGNRCAFQFLFKQRRFHLLCLFSFAPKCAFTWSVS